MTPRPPAGRVESTLLDLRAAAPSAPPPEPAPGRRVESTLLDLRAATPPEVPPERRVESTLFDLRRADAAGRPRLDETRASTSSTAGAAARVRGDPGALFTRLRTHERPPIEPPTDEPAGEGSEAIPLRIGRFLVLRQLGRGGMGVVYAAYDDQLDRKLAIKLLRDQRIDGADDRLLREAQALARLSHPNVVGVYEVDRALGSIYIAMEFVTGVTLREWLADRRRTTAELLGVFLQAGRGLEAAHAVGLIHRDFKPDNVMVGDDGRVRVFDFGLARSVTDEPAPARPRAPATATPLTSGSFLSTDMTIAGTILGTPAYMAPEQFKAAPTDARTDVFAFCVALYEALYDRRPFAGATFDELEDAVCSGDVAPIPRDAPVPAWLRQALLRGLEADPARRWQHLGDLLAALADDPLARRRRWLRAGALVTLIAAVALATPLAIGALRARWQAQAREEAAARRWEAISARLEALRAAERPEDADALFRAFADAAEVRGTRALTEAWLARGRQFYGDGDGERAMEAFASAYTGAPDAALERGTLLAMAEVFRERGDMGSLAPLVLFLSDADGRATGRGDPAVDALRVDVALDHRDFAAAADLLGRLGDAGPAPLRGLPPALRRLAKATDLGDVRGRSRELHGGALLTWPTGGQRSALAALQARDLDGGPPRSLAAVELPFDAHAVAGGPSFLLFHRGGGDVDADWRLSELTPEGLRERWRGPLPTPPARALAADIDGDGRVEVYVALHPYRRGLFRIDVDPQGPPGRGEPVIVDPTIDALGSDVLALAAHDVDGDGRPELLAGLGPWRAYDLRVLRWQGGGYQTLAHAELGAVVALGALRRDEGPPWTVVVTDADHPNRVVFPEPPHLGAPPGAHLLRWQDGALARGPTIPAPPVPAAGGPWRIARFEVGDLDGDGDDDFVVDVVQSQHHWVHAFLQQGEGDFAQRSLGEAGLVGLVQADDDPEVEVALEIAGHVWLLGHGPSDTPVVSAAPAPPRPPPAGLEDPSLAARWQRADRLATIGLEAIAARSLLELGELIDPGPPRAAVREQAGELFARAGERARAIEVLEAIDGDPARTRAARLKAAAHHAALGDFLRAAEALGEADDPTAFAGDLEAFAPFTVAELRRLADPARRVRVAFDRPLGPAWDFPIPGIVRRDPVRGRLEVAASAPDAPWAALPVDWDGGPLLVRADLEVQAMEYGGDFRVALRGEHDLVSGGLWVTGGAGHLDRILGATQGNVGFLGESPAEAPLRLEITLALSPETGRRMTLIQAGDDHQRLVQEAVGPLAAGRHTVVLGARTRDGSISGQTRLTVTSFELIGLRVAEPGDDPRIRGRALLVEGRAREAAERLAAAPLETAVDRLALALALAEDERWAEARAALAPLAGDEEALPQIAEVARARPRLRPVVSEVFGARAPLLRVLGAGITAMQHAREPFARRLLLEDFADLRRWAPDDLELRGTAVQILLARAGVLRELGDLEEAAADLDAARAGVDAVAPGPPPGDTGARFLRLGLHREEARLQAARGDLAGARAAVDRVLVWAIDRDLERDRLLRDPALQGIGDALRP